MSFWSTETFKIRSAKESIVDPFDASNIKHAAYELSLGDEAFITGGGTKEKVEHQLKIPAGQFALLLTDEIVSIPADAIGLISIKAGVKFKGLVNVSGFHVDVTPLLRPVLTVSS